MTKTLLALFFVSANSIGFAQTRGLPDLIIHYSNDPSVVLFALPSDSANTKLELIDAGTSLIDLDSLLTNFTIRVDYCPDSLLQYIAEYHIELDSASFSTVIKRSNLLLHKIIYGYGGARNYDDLTLKYGVKCYAGGCVYSPTDMERSFSLLMNKLLKIRNGEDWESEYYHEARRKSEHQ